MYAISDLFETYLDKRSREWLVKVDIAGTEYDANAIVDFEVDNSLAPQDEFVLGSVIISKLILRMKTTDEIAPNAKVIPSVRLQLPTSEDGANIAWQDDEDTWDEADYIWQGAVTEWIPLGEFYIDDRERINNIWTFTCLDKLVYADVPYISSLSYPATMQDVWDEICTSLSYTYNNVTIDPTYTFPAAPTGYTKRQVMGYIASANAACVYISKDGIVRFKMFGAADVSVFDMTQSKYIRAARTNPTKTYTRIVAIYDVDSDLYYEAGSGDDNATLYIENPFATQGIVDDLLAKLNGFSYTPVEIDARGYPQIESGDRMAFGVFVDTPAWDDAEDAWQDTDYTWLGYEDGGQTLALHTVFTFRGGLRMDIEAPSKSEQKSEFQVDGTLTRALQDIRSKAVRTDRTYFGVTITDDDGLIVEKSDHSSKVILNSDELTFYKGASKAIYFDVVDEVYKFNGTLEAADGVFSGTLSAATGTFDGVYSGDVTTDQLVAGSVLIGSALIDSINANQINVGTLTGFVIQTAATGERIVMSGSGFASYDASNNERISINVGNAEGTAGIYFSDASSVMGWLYADSSIMNFVGTQTLRLFGIQDLDLGTTFGEISFTGDVDFGGASIAAGSIQQSAVLNLESSLASKATKSAATTSVAVSDSHNHGFSTSDYIQCYDSGGNPTVKKQWIPYGGSAAHSHTQN